MIAGAFLLIGAVVSYLSAKASDTRKATGDAKIRWHEEVRKFSSQAVTAARAVEEVARSQRDLARLRPIDWDIKVDKSYMAMKERSDQAYKVLEALQGDLALVAPNNVIITLVQVDKACYSVRNSWGKEMETLADVLQARTLDFIVEVREYLGTDQDDIHES